MAGGWGRAPKRTLTPGTCGAAVFTVPCTLLWRLMQFSTNLPCGAKAVREYIEHRGESRLPMNVSAESDAAYIAEKGLTLGPMILKSWLVGTCARCSAVIHNAP